MVQKVKEHPILFSTLMVQAILEDRKTMTRRVIKPQPDGEQVIIDPSAANHGIFDFKGVTHNTHFCPYGQVGDRLWVRETFVLEDDSEYGYSAEELAQFRKDRPVKTETEGEYTYHLIPHYKATEPEPYIVSAEQMERDSSDDRTRWKPAIFMPHWASRITLEVTDIKVERLQEIEKHIEDYKKEGYKPFILQNSAIDGQDFEASADFAWFENLWDFINAKRGYSWESNPWVWVIKFRKIGN